MKKLLCVLFSVLLLLAVCSCSERDSEISVPISNGSVFVTDESSVPTNVEADIYGRITRISHTAEGTEILVENDIYSVEHDETQPLDKAVIKLDDKTALGTSSSAAIDLASLSAGMMVEVWFIGDATTESTPALAYAQAVRVRDDEAAGTILGIVNLPRMTVAGGSTHLSVVTELLWDGAEVKNDTLRKLAASNIGACLNAGKGDQLTIGFSMQPDSYTVSYSTSPEATQSITLETQDGGKINLPKVNDDEIFIRVDAYWGGNRVQYAVVINLLEQ